MVTLSVFYDFHEEKIMPMWIKANFYRGEVNWEDEYLYLSPDAPFLPLMCDEMEEEIGVAIHLTELTIHPEVTGQFGIYLPSVKNRIKQAPDLDPNEIRHFIIRLCDIEEVMQMNMHHIYEWR